MNRERLKGMAVGFVMCAVLILGGFMATANPLMRTRNAQITYGGWNVVLDGQPFEARDGYGNLIHTINLDGWLFAPFEHVAVALGLPAHWDGATNTLYLGGPTQESGSSFTLSIGQYVVGVDIPAGTYNLIAVSGSGNIIGDVQSQLFGSLNTILAVDSAMFERSFNNLRLANGDTINIMGNLVVEFTPR